LLNSLKPIQLILFVALLLASSFIASGYKTSSAMVKRHSQYRIIEKRPHNSSIYTQGLIASNNMMIENSGRYRRSFITRYPLGAQTPPSELSHAAGTWPTPKHLFAEGITLLNDQLYLLSWRKGIAGVYREKDLQFVNQFKYRGEGWGLTHNGQSLIMSDGSNKLQFRDPANFKIISTLAVTLNQRKLKSLNELEYHQGNIWANVWHKNYIVAIDPRSGAVTQQVDLSALVAESSNGHTDSVLNGIAADPEGRGLWVTGKYWPWLYLIEIQSP